MIIPYLNDLINNHRTESEWKVQLTMTINFISLKNLNENRIMHTRNDNIEFSVGGETD